MSVLPIRIHPDPCLKKSAKAITLFDGALKQLAHDMIDTMYDANGIGLAAPQIGKSLQVIVMDCDWKVTRDSDAGQTIISDKKPKILTNPSIVWQSDEVKSYDEGCLSIPEQFGAVERPSRVKIAYCDLDGTKQTCEFDDLWAVCVQHEIDHLNGILFIDHLSALKRNMITRKMLKYKKDIAQNA